MGDFSNIQVISKIEEIVNKIDYLTNTINLSSNCIKKADLDSLPVNIINVNLDDNILTKISWDDRNWDTISIKNNNFDTNEFTGLTCKKLYLDNNSIENITFTNCNFDELSIENNNIKFINFFDCVIKELNLSVNKITEIITLPSGLVKLNCYGNKIKNIFVEQFNPNIKYVDLSDNKLESIGKFPNGLIYLDLSKNKFKTFDTSILPNTLEYFDITENNISNNKELFGSLTSQKLFYDTDDDVIDTKSDSGSINSTESNASSDISIKLNKKFTSFENNYRELNSCEEFGDIIDDEDIANYIEEYKKENSTDDNIKWSVLSSSSDSNFLNFKNESETNNQETNNQEINNQETNNQETNNLESKLAKISNDIPEQKEFLTQRDIMLKAALDRFRESNNNQILKTNYSKTIPIELQWNFNL
jgi:hypothetical protein